jgi:hypothetical protein
MPSLPFLLHARRSWLLPGLCPADVYTGWLSFPSGFYSSYLGEALHAILLKKCTHILTFHTPTFLLYVFLLRIDNHHIYFTSMSALWLVFPITGLSHCFKHYLEFRWGAFWNMTRRWHHRII